MLTEARFNTIIALGHEQRGVECKGPGSRKDSYLEGKVIRAALALANKEGGGTIIIGVEDDGKTLTPIGLSRADLQTWKHDDIAQAVNNAADPYVTLSAYSQDFKGKPYVIIEVREFEDVPVICKRNLKEPPATTGAKAPGKTILRNGALYVRGHGKIESIEVPSHVELREVVDLAAEKAARRLLALIERMGEAARASEQQEQDSAASYDREIEDL